MLQQYSTPTISAANESSMCIRQSMEDSFQHTSSASKQPSYVHKSMLQGCHSCNADIILIMPRAAESKSFFTGAR